MNSNFFKAITYNIVNIFLYKIILQFHQSALLLATSAMMFGLIGTLFSSIYFLISITNIGFDYFIISYHDRYTESQQNLKKLIPIFIARIVTIAFVIVALWTINNYYKLCPVTNILDHTTPQLLAIIVIIFIAESIKKSLDALAQMSFLQKSISIFDISTLLIYVAFVWISYFIHKEISLYIVFIPMALISILECYLLARAVISFYDKLPISSSTSTPNANEIIKHQAVNYINQITKALFSPNFFIIILACNLGLSKAGHIKIFTDVVVLLYMLLNRSFGLPTAALFSSITRQAKIDPDQKNILYSIDVFKRITNWYIQFLYAIGTVIITLLVSFYGINNYFSSSVVFNVLLFVFAGFMEYLLITYEKWYLTQGKSWILAVINSINLVLYGFLFLVSSHIDTNFILLPIIILRSLVVGAIIYVTYSIWNISPSFKVHKWTIIVTTAISFFVFMSQFLISL